jgi:alpha-glucosidase
MKLTFLLSFLFGCMICSAQSYTISSPDKNIVVAYDAAKTVYTISYKGKQVMQDSKLGVVRDDEDFSKDLKLIRVSAPTIVRDSYNLYSDAKDH